MISQKIVQQELGRKGGVRFASEYKDADYNKLQLMLKNVYKQLESDIYEAGDYKLFVSELIKLLNKYPWVFSTNTMSYALNALGSATQLFENHKKVAGEINKALYKIKDIKKEIGK